MLSFSLKRWLAALLTWLLVSPLSGITFRALSWEGQIEGLYYEEKNEVIALSLEEERLSTAYEYSKSAPFEVFTMVSTPEGDVRVPVLSAEIPSNMSNAILLIGRLPGDQYQSRWLEHSFDYSPSGSVRFFNLSHNPVALSFGSGQPEILQPEDSMLYLLRDNIRRVSLRAATTRENGEWRLFSTLPIKTHSRVRTLVILRSSRTLETQEVGPVELFTLYDYSQPPREIL